jgi:hypothetical protein
MLREEPGEARGQEVDEQGVGRLPRRGSPEVKEGKEDPWKQSRGG